MSNLHKIKFITPKWIPPQALGVLENHLNGKNGSPAEQMYLKRFIEDKRMEELWLLFNRISESQKRAEAIWNFSGNSPFLPGLWERESGPSAHEIRNRGLENIIISSGELREAYLQVYGLIADKMIVPENFFETLIHLQYHAKEILKDKDFQTVKGPYKIASNFRNKKSDSSLKIYICRWAVQFFNKFFGQPFHRQAGVLAAVLCGLEDEIDAASVRQYTKDLKLVKKTLK